MNAATLNISQGSGNKLKCLRDVPTSVHIELRGCNFLHITLNSNNNPKPRSQILVFCWVVKSFNASTNRAEGALVFTRGNLAASSVVSSYLGAFYNGSCCILKRNTNGGDTKSSSSLEI